MSTQQEFNKDIAIIIHGIPINTNSPSVKLKLVDADSKIFEVENGDDDTPKADLTTEDLWVAALLCLQGAEITDVRYVPAIGACQLCFSSLPQQYVDSVKQLNFTRGLALVRLYDLRDEVRRLSKIIRSVIRKESGKKIGPQTKIHTREEE
jgi:hypothetical protein